MPANTLTTVGITVFIIGGICFKLSFQTWLAVSLMFVGIALLCAGWLQAST